MVTTAMNKHIGGDGKKGKAKRKPFKPNYDYEVDYNDHFETPLEAYEDILPLLDLILSSGEGIKQSNREDNKTIRERRKEHIIYDPYYCDGRTKRILRSLGFDKVVHEKRDFYEDIREQKVPNHHTLVTNPPYSDDHKEKCLQFCVRQFREQQIAFFLLIPNYVAARNYYRKILGTAMDDVAYLIPTSEYHYSHPEGTGHEQSPFSSLWFCCIGKHRIQTMTREGSSCYRTVNDNTNDTKSWNDKRPRFVASFDELVSLGVISLQNRPNPRQRKKMRKLAVQSADHGGKAAATGAHGNHPDRVPTKGSNKRSNGSKQPNEKVKKKKQHTKSKYRNSTGERTKKRF
jgi:hypothetical protein